MTGAEPATTPARTVRARRLLGELVRFLAVGGLATALSVLGFNVLAHGTLVGPLVGGALLGEHPLTAYVLANVAAGLVAYVGMRLWAFGHREVADPVQGVVRFFVLGAVTMAIPVLCLASSRYVLGLTSALADNIAANVVGLGLGTAARFWLFRRYVFTLAEESPEPAAERARP